MRWAGFPGYNPIEAIMRFNWFCGICVGVYAVLLSGAVANASPSPGIVFSDQLVGVTAERFYVLRTTTLRPPTYYTYHKRIEFVGLSLRDGQIAQRCTLRETSNQSDANADSETWTQTEISTAPCPAFVILAEQSAKYIEPQNTGPHAFSFGLGIDGVMVRNNASDQNSNPAYVIPIETILQRASEITTIPLAAIPWFVEDDPVTEIALIESALAGDPLHEVCELEPVPATSIRTTWVFLQFRCWSGDADVDGTVFHVPVDSAAWRKDME